MTPEDWRREPRAVVVATEEEAEARARAEHSAYAGRLLRVVEIQAYLLGVRDYCDVHAEAVVRVRSQVVQFPPWNDKWLDPYWDVDIVEHPQKDNLEHAWIYGRSYMLDEELNPMEQLAQAAWAPDYREAP